MSKLKCKMMVMNWIFNQMAEGQRELLQAHQIFSANGEIQIYEALVYDWGHKLNILDEMTKRQCELFEAYH